MRELSFVGGAASPRRVLCVGAHCDDVEIGCGATLVDLQERAPGVVVDWLILSGPVDRSEESRRSMRRLIKRANCGDLVVGNFRDGRFPAEYDGIKSFFEELKSRPAPDLIFCHERDDRHQDHRIVNEAVWTTFRDHAILEYEIPKWDGGLGAPNVYVPASARAIEVKVETLLDCYGTQRSKDWFTRETFLALTRLRGVECRSPSGHAEAFHARKLALRFG